MNKKVKICFESAFYCGRIMFGLKSDLRMTKDVVIDLNFEDLNKRHYRFLLLRYRIPAWIVFKLQQNQKVNIGNIFHSYIFNDDDRSEIPLHIGYTLELFFLKCSSTRFRVRAILKVCSEKLRSMTLMIWLK